jgi:hypothetical protein
MARGAGETGSLREMLERQLAIDQMSGGAGETGSLQAHILKSQYSAFIEYLYYSH